MIFRKILLQIIFFSILIPAQPRVVVGIVVDQMRFDYLYKFRSNFGPDGFNRLLNSGTNFTFAHYNYVPTHTAPGHTSIYTGSTPFFHGIIANEWYDRKLKHRIYCVNDERYKGVGGDDMMSPLRIEATTITDQLRLSNNGLSRVFAISLKDRGALLPGGRLANAAYWFFPGNGNFMTTTYYMNDLPDWVNKFNNRREADEYCAKEWTLSYPLENYKISLPDNSPLEPDPYSESRTSFPHSLKNFEKKNKFEMLKAMPFGNDLLTDFAEDLIANENPGCNGVTDFVTISYSSTDYIGHYFGPNSVEVHDTYIKLDKNLADIFRLLDEKYGPGNYLVFLTADHGADEIPELVNTKEKNYFSSSGFLADVRKFAENEYGSSELVADYINKQIFLDESIMDALKLSAPEVRRRIASYIRRKYDNILFILTREDMIGRMAGRNSGNNILNGFNQIRSGDVIIELNSTAYFESAGNKSTHNTLYAYDTHVPLLFYGWGIKPATINDPVFTTDIAATIADLLKITEPSASIGIPLIK